MRAEGRSALLKADAADVADAVGEAVEDDFHGLFAVYREDVA